MPNQSKNHSQLVDNILETYGALPGIRIWKRSVGFDEERKISYGFTGESDIDGIIEGGTRLHIECKTGGAVQTREQRKFHKMIISLGGIYVLAYRAEDVFWELKYQYAHKKIIFNIEDYISQDSLDFLY